MDNNYIIDQPAGLGDIFFCQKIAKKKAEKGKVMWPVQKSIEWVKNYLTDPNYNIEYITSEVLEEGYSRLILDGAQNKVGGLIMTSKYQIAGMEWYDWSKYFTFTRNIEKENYLYYDHLKLADEETYTFTNKNYGTPPSNIKYNFTEDFKGREIEMEILDGFTVFDWIKVIENASKIAIVDTCLNYIIEKLDVKATDLICYCRHGEYTFNQISPLFKKPWIYKWN